MKIYIGSDHGGFVLKQEIIKYLQEKNYEIEDVGCYSDKERCNYPVFGKLVAQKVVADKNSLGIAICGSGIGISMAANKVKGARAALANSVELAELARKHNGSNILALGARTKFYDQWKEIVETFLNIDAPEEGRYARRGKLLDVL